MNVYVQFCETRTNDFNHNTMTFEECTPYEVDCLGSDGVFILDGRNTIDTMIDDAIQQVKRLQYVKPWITSFKIIKGKKFGEGRTLANVKVKCETLPNGIKYSVEHK